MAKHLDLEEQEQLDQIKHFWSKYGNAITWVLIVVLGAFAAWNGWNWWQRSQSAKASALHTEIERAAQAKDSARLDAALADMQARFAGTAFAGQATLLAAKTRFEAGQADQARAALDWLVTNSKDEAYRSIARLRLAGIDIDAGEFDRAIRTLEAPFPAAFDAMAADRRGDALLAKGDAAGAKVQFEKAWAGLSADTEYRRLVEVKLASLGVDKSPAASQESRPS